MNKKMRWPLIAAMFGALVPMVWNFTPLTSGQRSKDVNISNPRFRTPVKGVENYDVRNDESKEAKQDSPRIAGQDQDPGITFGTSYHNDTSPRLRDMVQVPVTPNKVGLRQSIKAPKAMTARGIDSGAILVSGISADTNGEVGATQRVKIANKGYQIFDNLTGASVLGSSDISTIWAGFGGSCATGGAGDAVVLYDKVADRWVISQFASATGGKAVTEECFAVSTTGDATGSYYRYAFHLGTNFIDSPHLSVRPDGYLMGDSVFNESGTERLGNQFFVFDRKAMLAGTAATFTSPGLDTGVGETYSISADGVRLASAPGIVPAVGTLTINLTYASDATFTTAGLTAQNILDMKAANTYAAQQFTNNYTDPINVNIMVTAVPGTGTLGQSNTSLTVTTFANMVAKTVADATTADDATVTGVGGSMPAALVDPVAGAHNYLVSFAQAKALGISPDNAVTIDGTYTFGGGFLYTYDPLNRAVAGRIDYIAVSMHEFSEIMGRIGIMGVDIGVGSPSYMQFDLFHYTGAGARGLNNGAGRSFSINNGTTLLKAFNNAAVNGGDLQDWASGTNDAFNGFSSSSVKNDLTAVDLQAMDVIGYNFGTPGPVIQPDGAATITAESLSPPNNAPDPTEQVTANFPLKNVGGVSTTNLVATLQTSGGVTAIPAGENQNYGVVVHGGATVSRPFTFRADGTCGATITATFQLQDGATNLGNVTFDFHLGAPNVVTQTFSNAGAITINDAASATPYPSNITVSGAPTTITNMTVTLSGFNHTFPDDVDVLLVSPTGRKMIIFSDAGGSTAASSVNITLDDAASSVLPDSGGIPTGTYRPANYGAVQDPFVTPAPVAPYLTAAPGGTDTLTSAFTGASGGNPNGTWSLHVVDDLGGDSGTIAGGWSLTLVNTTYTCTVSSTLRIDSVSPQAGRTSGNQPITLTGAFSGLSTVTMGGVNAAWTGNTSTITVTTPAHAVGAVQIDLTPTAGSVYSKPNAFAYLPTVFTDNTLVVGTTTAKAQHIIELRQAVDAMRAVAGLAPAPWTDATLTPTSTIIKAVHIQELRTFLDSAASLLGYSTSPYTDPSLSGLLIKRVHIEELRQRIRAIAG